MKPFELIAALMARDKIGALPLAKKMKLPKLQPQIHRFSRGEVANPARTTAEPLAAYFKLPVDAIYDERLATRIAKELGLSVVPHAPSAATRSAPKTRKAASLDADTVAFAEKYQRLKPEERAKLRLLYQVARTGVHPENIRAATGNESASRATAPADGDSGLGDLDVATEIRRRTEVDRRIQFGPGLSGDHPKRRSGDR